MSRRKTNSGAPSSLLVGARRGVTLSRVVLSHAQQAIVDRFETELRTPAGVDLALDILCDLGLAGRRPRTRRLTIYRSSWREQQRALDYEWISECHSAE